MTTAKQILLAIRMKYPAASIVREVAINDDFERGRYYRWLIESNHSRLTEQECLTRGYPIANVLPKDYQPKPTSISAIRRIDALMFNQQGFTAIEIKVNKHDFYKDSHDKRAPWEQVTDRFIYAMPAGLINYLDVPSHCGIWEFDSSISRPTHYRHGLTTVKKSIINKNVKPIPNYVWKSFMSRISKYEKQSEAT